MTNQTLQPQAGWALALHQQRQLLADRCNAQVSGKTWPRLQAGEAGRETNTQAAKA